jgi:hypothetical protein
MRYGVFFVILFPAIIALPAVAAELNYARVQTYSMLPLDPEKAAAKGLTVNGLWAGFGQPEAVRGSTFVISAPTEFPVRYSYPTMEAYIEASHKNGILVPASVMGIAGHGMHRRRFPETENGACVGADGQRAYWDPTGDRTYFMCANNPTYREVLYKTLIEAIDAGADLLLIDEFCGNEACFYWSNQPGFCDSCLAAYRKHLSSNFTPEDLRAKFGIEDLSKFDFAKNLNGQREKPWPETSPLFKELWRMQERNNFESRKKLVTDLRAHMKEVGKVIPICANVTNSGLNDWGEGHWLKGLKWAELLDFVAFETGLDDHEKEFLPRGKWVAYERMAQASYRLPSAVIHLYAEVHAWEIEFLEGKSNHSPYLCAMAAEANANGCQYVNYFQPVFFPKTEPFWDPVFHTQKFIRDHKDIFAPPLETGANAAILYIENEGTRDRVRTYVGIATALAESHIPFDVVLDGGDGFVPAKLAPESLKKYQVLISPATSHLTAGQKDAIMAYVSSGGVLITPDTAEFGVAGNAPVTERDKGKFVALPKADVPNQKPCDIAKAYFLTFDDKLRAKLEELVRPYSKPVLEAPGADRTLSVYPHYQAEQKRIVVHVINSDYDAKSCAMRPKESVLIRLNRPSYYAEAQPATIYSPDFPDTGEGQTVSVTPVIKGDFIEFVVPKLAIYDVIVL